MDIRNSRDQFNQTNIAIGQDSEFICVKCGKQMNEGFICENDDKLILCQICQDKFIMGKCKHDINHEHKHIKFIRGVN